MLTRVALAWALSGALVAGCAAPATTSGSFTQTARVETDLKRGVSTKRDVQHVLGTPKGSGTAVLPTDPRGREIWYYEDIKIANMRKGAEGYVLADISQRVLLVFFRDGLFDGFMWFTGGGATEPK